MTGSGVDAVAWVPLGGVSPSALGAARAELHRAASAVEQVGKALVEPEEDYSHIALRWSPEHEALVTGPTDSGARAGLRLGTGQILALDAGGETADAWTLAAGTLDDAATWVRERMVELAGADPEWKPLRSEGLRAVGVAQGGVFSFAGAAHRELGRWFADAAYLLEPLSVEHDEAGPVLCWPHHFDIATLLSFEPDVDPEEARSVNLGFSPGDDASPGPYFYVVPWPPPDPEDLPSLDGPGRWRTEDWVGGFLASADVVALAASAQEKAVDAFMRGRLEAAKGALGL